MRVVTIALLFTFMVLLHSIEVLGSGGNSNYIGISRRMDRNMKRRPGERFYGIDPPGANHQNNNIKPQSPPRQASPIRPENRSPPRSENRSPPRPQNRSPPRS